jgi:PQQ-dependent dehydrogenase (s-GDH family)
LLPLAIGGSTIPSAQKASEAQQQSFAFRVVATGLSFPWEITWGPDDHLWVTERAGKCVTRVRPSDGSKSIALTIPDAYLADGGQDGVLGMALHPELLKGTGSDFVYVALTYDADPRPGRVDRRAMIRRYRYDSGTHTLESPLDLITHMPASNDHNSGRLVFGPDQKLYYTIGDQGGNQFGNACNPIRSQEMPSAAAVGARDWTKYPGKVLRLNLDGSIPSDNPILAGVKRLASCGGLPG